MPRIRVQAPAGTDRLLIAQAVAGPHVLLKAEPLKTWQGRPFDRWPALNGLYKRSTDLYDRMVHKMAKRLQEAVSGFAEANLAGKLSKAAGGPPVMPLLTSYQLETILGIVRDYHTAYGISIGGDMGVPRAEIDKLIEEGTLPAESHDILTDGYLYGQLLGSMRAFDEQSTAKGMDYAKFKNYVERRPTPLTQHEQAAIDWAKTNAGQHIRGLGNTIADEIGEMAMAEDADLRRKYVGEIKDLTAANIEHRKSWRKLASDIGHSTGDWSRDMGRIAATETQSAFQEGYATSLIEREGDPKGIMVAKLPKPSACPDCVRLHLTAGQGSAPRAFTLDELVSNGSNVGRKRRAWEAGIGPVHPWCMCEIVHIPPGWEFEQEPDDTEAWEQVGKSKAYRKKRKDGEWEYWRSRQVPGVLRRSERFTIDLRKSFMQYTNVPDKGCVVRVGDPEIRAAVDEVLGRCPKEVFDRRVGVTLITTDISRPQVALDLDDLAYWTGNEIRISQTLPLHKVKPVMEHELGHSLNVYLMNKYGSEGPVYAWQNKLDRISKREGYVSKYAASAPIENAAEVTRLYLFERPRLILEYPKQYAYVNKDYRNVIPPMRLVFGRGNVA